MFTNVSSVHCRVSRSLTEDTSCTCCGIRKPLGRTTCFDKILVSMIPGWDSMKSLSNVADSHSHVLLHTVSVLSLRPLELGFLALTRHVHPNRLSFASSVRSPEHRPPILTNVHSVQDNFRLPFRSRVCCSDGHSLSTFVTL